MNPLVATEEAIDIRPACAVPCVLAPPSRAKQVLQLLRDAGWHPQNHSRLVLDRRPGKIAQSDRAYQVTDASASVLDQVMAAVSAVAENVLIGEHAAEVIDEDAFLTQRYPDVARALDRAMALDPNSLAKNFGPAKKLVALLLMRAARWQPQFQLHEYIIDDNRCDFAEDAHLPTKIRYLPAQFSSTAPDSDTSGKSPPAAGSQSAAEFTFAELFAGIGGFRVGLESLAAHADGRRRYSGQCVLASEINPWARLIYALNFGGAVREAAAAAKGGGAKQGAMRSNEGETLDYIAGEIQRIRGVDCPAHDILTAGFPCRTF